MEDRKDKDIHKKGKMAELKKYITAVLKLIVCQITYKAVLKLVIPQISFRIACL